jgi:TonB family protein
MHYQFLTAILITIISPFISFGQQGGDKPYKIEKDTMYAMVFHDGKIVNLPGAPYIRKWWPEKGKYREFLFISNTGNLTRKGWFRDKECTIMDGIFENFYEDGNAKDSGNYINGKKEGTHLAWYKSGQEQIRFQFKNGIPVDTCFSFFEDGNLSSIMILDDAGNGIEQIYFSDGKVKMLGRVSNGTRDGTWVLKREDGTKMMEVLFMADSVANTYCFEADGKTPAKGDCIYEKAAEFPGGNKGWADFLRKNMKYPDYAIRNGIQGIVRVQFVIAKDGTADEFKVISSPDQSLSDEVLRFMKKSPKWLPAIQYNKPVIYRHIQAVTFRLE